MPTVIDIFETTSRTALSPAFLLYQLWLCSSEDEIGACCAHTQISEETGAVEKFLCNSTRRLLLVFVNKVRNRPVVDQNSYDVTF